LQALSIIAVQIAGLFFAAAYQLLHLLALILLCDARDSTSWPAFVVDGKLKIAMAGNVAQDSVHLGAWTDWGEFLPELIPKNSINSSALC
jgi:hypothetical protein